MKKVHVLNQEESQNKLPKNFTQYMYLLKLTQFNNQTVETRCNLRQVTSRSCL